MGPGPGLRTQLEVFYPVSIECCIHPILPYQASSDIIEQEVNLEVFLTNGKKVVVSVGAFEPSYQALEVSVYVYCTA